MASLKQRIYWKCPAFLQSLLASWHARRLDRERFGPAYGEVLRDIATREGWSAEQFADYQRRELVEVVRHAARKVPYYRRAWPDAGVDPESIQGPEDLPRLPILEKDIIREDPVSLIDETLDPASLIVLHTSGTTGTPLELYRDVWQNSALSAYITARFHRQAGVERRRNRSVSVGGHMVTDPARAKPPFWVYNRLWRQLYMSSYHLARRHLGAYVERIRRFRPDYIEGYPSSVYAIARHVVENDLAPVPMKACFTTAEPLLEHQRRAMERAFACRTYDQYGCGEMAVLACECPDGALHLNPEFGIVEVLDNEDRPLPAGESGQLVCTSLINRVQLLIRYRIGDWGAIGTDNCSCGSGRPVLGRIEGRMGSVLVAPDGREIGEAALSLLYYGVTGVAETQITQESSDRFRVRLVPGRDYTETQGRKVVANLAQRLGPVDIRLEIVDRIERTPSGKFQTIVPQSAAEAGEPQPQE